MQDRRLAGTDLNLLVAFDALMAERSVTRAAERMSIGQPAMSAALARLRRVFADPLLVRQGRGMVTTALADSLIPQVREALSLIERTLAGRSPFDPAATRRTFTIIASDYVTLVMLRPLLSQLETEAPAVRLHVGPVTASFESQLLTGRADLVIIPCEFLGSSPELVSTPLFNDRFVCAVGGDNDQVADSLTVEELSKQPYLAFDSDPLGSIAEEQLDAAGITRNLEVSIESFLLAPFLLRRTRLISLMQERLARMMQSHVDIRILKLPVDLAPITEMMVWSPHREHDPGHTWLRAQLRKTADEL